MSRTNDDFDSSDLVGMFGMSQMEQGVAHIINMARQRSKALWEVQFTEADLHKATGDTDAFRGLQDNGWLVPCGDDRSYRLDTAAVRRVLKKFPAL